MSRLLQTTFADIQPGDCGRGPRPPDGLILDCLPRCPTVSSWRWRRRRRKLPVRTLAPAREGEHPLAEMGQLGVIDRHRLPGRIGVVMEKICVIEQIAQLNGVGRR
jgi:hypothetical protein